MAVRKATLTQAPERPELDALLAQARTSVLTEDQMSEQRASFAYGNAPARLNVTKASALEASRHNRLIPA